MSILSLIKRAPKQTSAVVLMIAAAIIIPASLFAWGPSRTTYTVAQPADKITFNSITDNPNYGDERNFVTIKDTANQNAGGWVDDLTVQNNKEYFVRMYVHNNAAANLNFVAENVTAKFNVPTQNANQIQIDGYLSSTNADPTQVWDQAIFHGSGSSKFQLQYVAGSASYTNNVFTSGTSLSDSVVSTGAKLGYNQLDGKIPGCFQYDGVVIFKVKATTSDFDVQKTVRINGATDKTFKESVNAKAGDKVDYQVYFHNTGGVKLDDVVVKDTLPAGVSYVAGSTTLYNANGTKSVSDGVTTTGLNIGDYTPNSNAYLRFTAQIASNANLPICGPNTLKNVAKATTVVGAKEDDANVVVPKECQPENITVCELSTKKIVTINKNAFDATKYSTDLSKCDEPKKITVCNLSTKTIVAINESDFDSTKYSKNLNDCELPHTGPTENIVAFLGLGALAASVTYYVRSRRFQV